jgi:lysophospholipase L1-like esterase
MRSHQKNLFPVIALSVLLMLSLGINYFLFKQGEQYYLQLNALRLDPLGLKSYESLEQHDSDLPVVVFFGDSRAKSWPAPELEQYEYINRGLGSQTTAQVVERFEEHVSDLRPQIIVVQVGVNDLKTIPLFPDAKSKIIDECEMNIQRIIEKASDIGATVILTTIFPTGRVPIERMPFWSEDVESSITEVNDYIHTLGSENVIVFDAYSILVDNQDYVRPDYSHDLLHLTNSGYIALNIELVHILEDIE